MRTIRVRSRPGDRRRGWLSVGPLTIPVALGRSGIRRNKREGDGATPAGTFRLARLWWRPDRSPRPAARLPLRRIRPDLAWDEDPASRRYNRPFRHDGGGAGDRLWREDHLYDLILELDHNTRPRIAGRGSAVFLHLARPGYEPTAGCVAMTRGHFRALLRQIGPGTLIEIG